MRQSLFIVIYLVLSTWPVASQTGQNGLSTILDTIDSNKKSNPASPTTSSSNKNPNSPEYEETAIVVFRTFSVKTSKNTTETIRVPVPVYYRTRSIALDPDAVAKVQAYKKRLDAYIVKLEAIKAAIQDEQEEGSQLATDYEPIIVQGIPTEALNPDSPTLSSHSSDGAETLKAPDIQIKVDPKP